MSRVAKFSRRRVAPNAFIRYQSLTGYSVEIGTQVVGKLERMVAGQPHWEIELFGKDYKIEHSFEDAKQVLRNMLAKHYPVKEPA